MDPQPVESKATLADLLRQKVAEIEAIVKAAKIKEGQPSPAHSEPPPRIPLLLLILVLGGLFIYAARKRPPTPPEEVAVEKFTSEEDFKTYLQEAEEQLGLFGGVSTFAGGDLARLEGVPSVEMAAPQRVSQTTVQVRGIDEPDIVKTDGTKIYFSSIYSFYYSLGNEPALVEKVVPPIQNETKIITAFPPANLAKEGAIDKTGDLLLSDNILVLFSGNKLYGYDISNPKSPVQKWSFTFEDSSSLVSARLYGAKIYLVAKTTIDTSHPCPVPLIKDGVPLTIACTDIYRPKTSVPVDVTFTALTLDPNTGSVSDRVSFVGSSGSSLVYMSMNALYATYTYYEDIAEFFFQFFLEEGQDLVSASVLNQLRRLKEYEISSAAKLVEFQIIFERYLNTLDKDERLRIENEMTNRMSDYMKEHMRELEKTGIVKIELANLDVDATGEVPGHLLNQFSLDEYQDYLRVATTVTGGILGTGESANDVYVLDEDLNIAGSIKGLGLEEQIYSVRFVEDKGYIVTFKQIDPFFVLDLSTPSNPQLKGELKIPGYSSYLHPITKDKILGIGKESAKVKISLFDVSSPENPTEATKYLLDEYWSDVLNTHHAFLLDTKHSVFFLPGSKGGYVFSYGGNQLKLERAVSDIQARRAIYIEDFMYIIGSDKVVVVSELDWQTVNQLEL